MKTLLISGDAPPPAPLRDVVERGSTAFEERCASDVSPDAATELEVDRIVFWAGAADAAVRSLARDCARAERAQRREAIVFVTPQGTAAQVEGLSPHEVFEWPCDEDRLKMAFMTGA
jgi:hypothetical protein